MCAQLGNSLTLVLTVFCSIGKPKFLATDFTNSHGFFFCENLCQSAAKNKA